MTTKEDLIKIVKEKGIQWAVAAVVDGSIGYYTPDSAARIIKNLLECKGELTNYSERNMCCFKCDAIAELERDFKCFSAMEEYDSEKVKKIIEVTKAATNLSTVDGWAFSCGYPTAL